MVSEIVAPAIFAKGYDFYINYAVGLTPYKFCGPHSKSLLNLEESYLLPSADLTRPLSDARFVEYQKIGIAVAVTVYESIDDPVGRHPKVCRNFWS